ncbi:hypothetical protein [Ferrovibrio sp.]|uniref:hypothetical protein n=1 Tax=Ferrovibrio sp. TaxID=1917215 RepID=UPI001B5B0F6B|nr:hypothetical protein [Ferrovibrio sp.]MBP7064716.1 hypothetical protein [Ferrovibrio sp.]
MKIAFIIAAAAGLLFGTAQFNSAQAQTAGTVTGITAPVATQQGPANATNAATQDALKKSEEAKKAAEEAAKKK